MLFDVAQRVNLQEMHEDTRLLLRHQKVAEHAPW